MCVCVVRLASPDYSRNGHFSIEWTHNKIGCALRQHCAGAAARAKPLPDRAAAAAAAAVVIRSVAAAAGPKNAVRRSTRNAKAISHAHVRADSMNAGASIVSDAPSATQWRPHQ